MGRLSWLDFCDSERLYYEHCRPRSLPDPPPSPLATLKTLADLDGYLTQARESDQKRKAHWKVFEDCAGSSGPRDGCNDYGPQYCHRHRDWGNKAPHEVTMPTVEQIAECVARLAKGAKVKK